MPLLTELAGTMTPVSYKQVAPDGACGDSEDFTPECVIAGARPLP